MCRQRSSPPLTTPSTPRPLPLPVPLAAGRAAPRRGTPGQVWPVPTPSRNVQSMHTMALRTLFGEHKNKRHCAMARGRPPPPGRAPGLHLSRLRVRFTSRKALWKEVCFVQRDGSKFIKQLILLRSPSTSVRLCTTNLRCGLDGHAHRACHCIVGAVHCVRRGFFRGTAVAGSSCIEYRRAMPSSW